MGLIDILKSKDVYIEVLHDGGKYLRIQWENIYANNLCIPEKRKIYLGQHLWHLFSYRKIECFEREEAMNTFNKTRKNECYIFYQNDDEALKLNNAVNIKAIDFDSEYDIYIVDKNLKWTYVHTHEEYCGPYFYNNSNAIIGAI